MPGLDILDVVIGLFFVYLTLALAVTAANEMLAAWLKRRAWMLQKGLVGLLEDPALVKQFVEHPLVRGLYLPRWSVTARIPGLGILFGNGPSYVSSRTFATVVVDLVKPTKAPDGSASFTAEGPLASVLSLLWKESHGDLDRFKVELEGWFENGMERVSGWYKRHTQVISLLLAIAVTVGTNADTVVIARALWKNPALREATVKRAEQYVSERDRPGEESEVEGDDDAAPPPPLPPDQQAEIDFDRASRRFSAAISDLNELQLPIGWEKPSGASCAQMATDSPGTNDPEDQGCVERLVPDDTTDDWPGTPFVATGWLGKWAGALGTHLGGWIITILAISLGAPFWFDMLNKVISVRSAGKAPEEEQKRPKVVPKPREPPNVEAT